MAVNLFFNTAIDAHGVLTSDEPWSRPGDYVLFRALTDIVCVNSACPDDTSPANGWYPTDIHVRTYSGAETFSAPSPIAPRPIGAEDDQGNRLSRPHLGPDAQHGGIQRLLAAAGLFAERRLEEYWACREKAAVVLDLSPLRKFEVTGPDAEALMQWVPDPRHEKAERRGRSSIPRCAMNTAA
jgi:aminomethyltransferase